LDDAGASGDTGCAHPSGATGGKNTANSGGNSRRGGASAAGESSRGGDRGMVGNGGSGNALDTGGEGGGGAATTGGESASGGVSPNAGAGESDAGSGGQAPGKQSVAGRGGRDRSSDRPSAHLERARVELDALVASELGTTASDNTDYFKIPVKANTTYILHLERPKSMYRGLDVVTQAGATVRIDFGFVGSGKDDASFTTPAADGFALLRWKAERTTPSAWRLNEGKMQCDASMRRWQQRLFFHFAGHARKGAKLTPFRLETELTAGWGSSSRSR
jgi:hypothetical protein